MAIAAIRRAERAHTFFIWFGSFCVCMGNEFIPAGRNEKGRERKHKCKPSHILIYLPRRRSQIHQTSILADYDKLLFRFHARDQQIPKRFFNRRQQSIFKNSLPDNSCFVGRLMRQRVSTRAGRSRSPPIPSLAQYWSASRR